MSEQKNKALGRQLILDELFDLTLYIKFSSIAKGELKQLLEELIFVEKEHYAFWKKFFNEEIVALNPGRKLKLWFIVLLARLFSERIIYLILESIEIYGIRKYLIVWEKYKDGPLGEAVREILEDELQHEGAIVSVAEESKIDGERIRNIFLGFNDGLVEVLGAISGFFAAFSSTTSVLIAGFTIAVAGAFSMAAGVFVSSGSEREVTRIEVGKKKFLGSHEAEMPPGSPLRGAITVGISYLIGSAIPIFPVLFGATNVAASFTVSIIMMIIISLVLSFISGMDIQKRILTNVLIIILAVLVTYALGSIVRHFFGIVV